VAPKLWVFTDRAGDIAVPRGGDAGDGAEASNDRRGCGEGGGEGPGRCGLLVKDIRPTEMESMEMPWLRTVQ
jgi:hypothetical protein